MRITNSTILRGYNRNLNRLMNSKTSSEHKILTGRKFDRASEAPLSAAKALNIRKSLYETEQYKENLDVASKFYTEAETSLLQVSEQMSIIRETIIAACNSTKDRETDLNIYAQQLETKASELCSIFNTDTAGRVIFGGESNDPEPFTIQDGMVMYHGVPVNAYNDPNSFPCSNDVYIDIGIGMVINQQTQEIDPQSVLKVSFNGADVTGCGAEAGTYDINLDSIVNGREYSLDIFADGVKKTITFTGKANAADNVAEIQAKLDEAFKKEAKKPTIDDTGIISVEGGCVCGVHNVKSKNTLEASNNYGYTDSYYIKPSNIISGQEYKLRITAGDTSKIITFTGGADSAANVAAVQAALDKEFGAGVVNYSDDGYFTCEGANVSVRSVAEPFLEIGRDKSYSDNYIQLTLDAAKALRNGDIEYANGCIDRIVTATENLLLEVADLGCNEEYIDFNISRFDTRELNLKDRQKTLEATNLEEEITLMKTYEALYNACLQMSSTIIPNSIFSYIR